MFTIFEIDSSEKSTKNFRAPYVETISWFDKEYVILLHISELLKSELNIVLKQFRKIDLKRYFRRRRNRKIEILSYKFDLPNQNSS